MELETFVNHGNLNFSISATQRRKKWLFSEVGSWLAPLETLRRYSEIISGEMTIGQNLKKWKMTKIDFLQ